MQNTPRKCTSQQMGSKSGLLCFSLGDLTYMRDLTPLNFRFHVYKMRITQSPQRVVNYIKAFRKMHDHQG